MFEEGGLCFVYVLGSLAASSSPHFEFFSLDKEKWGEWLIAHVQGLLEGDPQGQGEETYQVFVLGEEAQECNLFFLFY